MKVLVAGAGVGGLTAAICLRRFGFDVEIYERRTELRAAAAGQMVMSNALVALDSIGIDLNLPKHGAELVSCEVRTSRGKLIRRLPLPEVCQEIGQPTVLISRADLQEALLDAAVGIPLHLGKSVAGYRDDNGVRLRFTDNTSARGDVLVGADGARSVVRQRLAGYEPVVDSGYLCWLALTHSRVPAGSVTYYWGTGQRFGLIGIGGGRAYWWGTKNMPAEQSARWRGGKDDVLAAFAGWADEVVRVIDATDDRAIIAVPSRDRPFLTQWGTGPVTLLGEAAHPMLAGIGQRSGIAIEDAVVLATSLARSPDEEGLRRYEDLRRDRTRAMVVAARAMCEFEQAETAERRVLRDLRYRFLPQSRLAAAMRRSLTFVSGVGERGTPWS